MGYRGGLYGSMGDQVLGLEAVLPDGEVLRTRAVPKSSAGIDLKSLLIGGEGCFGIITEATIRIFPAPEERSLHALRFESFEVGYNAIQEMFRQRVEPAVLDFGDADVKFQGGAMLYLGFEGNREVVEAEERRALSVCERFGAEGLPQKEAERFWNDRHEIARRFMQNRRQRRERSRDGVYRDWIHVALPASKVLSFRAAAMEIAKKRGVQVLESGLWIQPELFSMPLGIQDDGTNKAQLALEETVQSLRQCRHRRTALPRLREVVGRTCDAQCRGNAVHCGQARAFSHGHAPDARGRQVVPRPHSGSRDGLAGGPPGRKPQGAGLA